MIRSSKSSDLSSLIDLDIEKTSPLTATALSLAQPIKKASSPLPVIHLQQGYLQPQCLTPQSSDYPIDLSNLIPLTPLDSLCQPHQNTVQAFLNDIHTELTDYFNCIGEAKSIDVNELHPTFLAHPINYADIQAIAEKAFTDTHYAKDHPRDGCYARAELVALALDQTEESVGKIFVTEAALVLKRSSLQNIAWNYHVAAAAVSKEDHQLWVIDPCLSKNPIRLQHWLEQFLASDTVQLTFTHAKYQYQHSQHFRANYDKQEKRIKKSEDALAFLAKNGYAPNQGQLSFGYFVQITEDQTNHF
jgi:Glutaminase